MRRAAIPEYFLYGEAVHDVDERFLHVESIAARSRLHDWTIRPHAHRDLHHLLLVTQGGGVFHAEGFAHPFAPPALISVPCACVHGFQFLPATDGSIVTASGALLTRIAGGHAELTAFFDAAIVLALPRISRATLSKMFALLAEEFRGSRPGRRAAAESTLVGILVHALRLKLQSQPQAAPARNADSLLVARYRALIEEGYGTDTSIATYASRLCVSQERLRLACVRGTGTAPLVLLNARRLLEAKRNLLYTNMSIAMIAEVCGFADAAYFSRFFARNTGSSPGAYRRAGPGSAPAAPG